MDQMKLKTYLESRSINNINEIIDRLEHFFEETKTLEEGFGNHNEFRKVVSNFVKQNNLNKQETTKLKESLKIFSEFTNDGQLKYNCNKMLGIGVWQQRLSDELEEKLGHEKRDEILKSHGAIKATSSDKKKSGWTKQMIDKFKKCSTDEELKSILQSNLHFLPPPRFLKLRKKFEKTQDIDGILKELQQAWVNAIENKYGRDSLEYKYIISAPYIEGKREGNKIITLKIPHNLSKFLRAETENEKKFYACHCPWVRDSLRNDNLNIDPVFCNCSAGFHKVMFDVIFDCSVEVRVLKSVLSGDYCCMFEIVIPEGTLKVNI